MKLTRRDVFQQSLSSMLLLGMRSIASGLPAAVLLNPQRGLAAAACQPTESTALIYSVSSLGDPVNCNVPGTYHDPAINHTQLESMAPVELNLGGRTVVAAKPWQALEAAGLLDKTAFIHLATNTFDHRMGMKVQQLHGDVARQEQLISVISRHLQPQLCSLQAEPFSLGAKGAGESVYFAGAPQPMLSPRGVAALLSRPETLARLEGSQKQRDADLDAIAALLRKSGNAVQREVLDKFANSQQQARQMVAGTLDALAGIQDNGPRAQVVVAAILAQMRLTPAVQIHIPFGGDNHADLELRGEAQAHAEGTAHITALFDYLNTVGMRDKVTFALLNVFGRTQGIDGRDHNAKHGISVVVGKNVKGGVMGGAELNDARRILVAQPLDSASGQVNQSGDVPFNDLLTSAGKTMARAVGLPVDVIEKDIPSGKIITAALRI